MKLTGFNNQRLHINTSTTYSNGFVKSNAPNSQQKELGVTSDIVNNKYNHKTNLSDTEVELTPAQIEALRAELFANPVSSEKLANVLFNYMEDNSWKQVQKI